MSVPHPGPPITPATGHPGHLPPRAIRPSSSFDDDEPRIASGHHRIRAAAAAGIDVPAGAGRASFDDLLAAADQGGDALIDVMGVATAALGDAASQQPPARSVDDADPELVPGLTYARAAQITAAISRHAAVVDAAAVEVEAHIGRRGLDLAVRDHVSVGFRLGQQVIRPRDGACRVKLLWTVHDVQVVSYAPAINRRPGMPAFEVATVARFEANPGRELSPTVVAAAAIAIVDALDAS